MAKNILVLSASPRKGGNSDLLCDQFMRGAAEAGHQAEKIFSDLAGQLVAAGILTDLDIDHLAMYCALYSQAAATLAAGGDIRPSLIGVLRGMAADLGLTPASRERLSVRPATTASNEFDSI